jgi:DNA/RNA-binding domain of Phe-tRNA-synthetase-like protein
MLYSVETEVFDMFPAFRRGVLVASDIDNSEANPEVTRLLSDAVASVPAVQSDAERLRVEVWDEAYRKFGADPKKVTPSISFLLKQIRRGKPPRSINTVVDLFNFISLRWTVPCGGDDITAPKGDDLRLGFARGDETFSPLFKPELVETPDAGEVIYYTPQTRRVLCRRWTWRNSDFSKLTTATRAVAINVDMMVPPFFEADVAAALSELAEMIKFFCGGQVKTHLLTPTSSSFHIAL